MHSTGVLECRAFNIVDGLTMQAVLSAAEDARSPIIIQTSVKTVRAIGVDVLFALWSALSRQVHVPACLHLDHCADRALISACLTAGWSSVLFDASELPYEENLRQTREVVAEAARFGAGVEGEIESIKGVEDGVGSDTESRGRPWRLPSPSSAQRESTVLRPRSAMPTGCIRRPLSWISSGFPISQTPSRCPLPCTAGPV